MTTYTVGPSGSGADYIVSGSNDQVEINSALQAAADTPGSTVYLLENTYDIYATNLRIGSNTTLTGDSGAILKLNNSCSWASMVPVIGQIGGTGTATSNVEIHGFQIDCNEANLYDPTSGRIWGKGYYNAIYICGASSAFASNIHVHDMIIHDSLGDAVRIYYTNNANVHDITAYNMQHATIFFVDVVGGEIYDCTIQHITNAGIRLDDSQSVKIHNNTLSDWLGTTTAPTKGASAIQIGNQPTGHTRLTNTIDIYENELQGGLAGILFMDALGTAGTVSQAVHIYNNSIKDCGICTWAKYNAGISVWNWGNGLEIDNNSLDGNYGAGILLYGALSGSKMYVSENNIINSKNTLASSSTYQLGVSGYGLLNYVPSSMAVSAQDNYMTGNVTGTYYQVTPLSVSTSLNGDYTTGSTTTSRYIAPIRIIQEDLTDYYIEGQPKLGYINGIPFYWQAKSTDVGKEVGQKKAPGKVGWNLTDFDFGGGELTLDCFAFSMDDLYEVISAFYDTSRGRATLELGGPYTGKQVSGLAVNHSSSLRLTTDVPENAHPYSILFSMDKPYLEGNTQRVRGRHVYGTSVWSSDDTYAGNLLKNPSFENWTTSNEMTWDSETSTADNTWNDVAYSDELTQYCAVASSGTNNRIMISSGSSWSTPTGLTSAANCNNDWHGVAWGSTFGADTPTVANYRLLSSDGYVLLDSADVVLYSTEGGPIFTGMWVAVGHSAGTDGAIYSGDGTAWAAGVTPVGNWDDVIYIRNDLDKKYRYVAVGSSGTKRSMFTDDGGATWTAVATADDSKEWVALAYSPTLNRIVAVAYSGEIMYSDNYGASWTAATSPAAQKWTDVEWAGSLNCFVAISEDGTQQVATSTTGITWTLRDTPYGSSTLTPGGGSDVETTNYVTAEGYVYSSMSLEYAATSMSLELSVVLPALSGGNIYRIDGVFTQLRTALAGKVAYMKVTVQADSLYSGVETQIAEWTENTASYVPKVQALAIESATDETVTIRYYMKTSDSAYRAYATRLGYVVTEVTTGGSSIAYTYNEWQGLEWSEPLEVLVAVAKTGTGNNVMYSTDISNWIMGESSADNQWAGICYGDNFNKFVAVGQAGTGNRIMSSDDYGVLNDISPLNWEYVSAGQSRSDETAHDGLHCIKITGDGATEDRGQIRQYASFDQGTSYVLSAWGSVSGRTAGKLAVDIYSGNSIIIQLIWDADCEYTQKHNTVRFDTAPTDAYIRVHGIETANSGAVFYCDDVLLEKASDFELGTTGNSIETFGHENVIPDVEITAVTSTSGTSETDGNSVTYVHPTVNSEYLTAYDVEYSVTLPALTDNKKYRLDRVSCGLGTGASGATAYMKVTATIPSRGGEFTLAEWTSTSVIPNYTQKTLSYSVTTEASESIILKYYMKTSSASVRAYAENISYVYTEIIPSVTSSPISIYNTADTFTVMECCNELRPNCKITINANGTGNYQYSENFADTTYENTVTEAPYVTYYEDYKMVQFAATGYMTFRFDTKFPITGVPYIVLNVVSGAPQIWIAEDDGNGEPDTWYEIDGNVETELNEKQAYRLLNSEGNLELNGLTKFHIKITGVFPNFMSINSIFVYAETVTIDAERPKIYKGIVNTFGAVVDSTSSVVVTLKYRDADLLV